MANTTSLADLRVLALDYADMTGSGFVVTDRVRDYINAALSDIQDIMVNSGADWFQEVHPITLVSGTEEYALPTTFYRVMKVFYLSDGRRYRIRKFDLDSIDGYRTSPISGGSVELWYVPTVTKLSADIDTVLGIMPNGWEDYAALFAAVRLKAREESDVSALSAERDRVKAKIIQLCEPRDEGEVDQVYDHYNRWKSYRQSLHNAEERYLRYRLLGDKIHFLEMEYRGVGL